MNGRSFEAAAAPLGAEKDEEGASGRVSSRWLTSVDQVTFQGSSGPAWWEAGALCSPVTAPYSRKELVHIPTLRNV